jgi:hypothetical protein
MTSETAVKWTERVRAWRASGKSAEAFAADQDFQASTLRFWASRLKAQAAELKPSTSSPVAMARVVRQQARPATASIETGAELAIVIGGARVTVSRGFDAALLREVVAALGVGK